MSVESVSAASARKPGLFILIAMSALGPVALNIFIPSMPGLQTSLNTDYGTAQLTLTLYLASLAISQLFVGPLSDRFGRRPIVLAGTALYIVASLACAFAGTIEQLIVGRLVQAAGGCAGIALARAIVRDLYDRDRAASLIGYVTMAMVVAPMMSPTIGGFLDEWTSWRASFFLVAAFGALVLAISLVQLHETNHARGQSMGLIRLARNSAALVREPAFVGYALNSAFGSGVFFAFLSGGPFVAREIMGLSPSAFGLYFILVSLGYMFGNFLSGRYASRYGANRLIAAGSLFSLTGLGALVAFALADIIWPISIFLPMGFVAIANGLTIPSATASAISVRPDIAGAGAGLTGFLQIGVGGLSTFAVSSLHDGTQMPMVIIMVASGLTAIIFLSLALWASRRQPLHG